MRYRPYGIVYWELRVWRRFVTVDNLDSFRTSAPSALFPQNIVDLLLAGIRRFQSLESAHIGQ